ncbi:MAG: NAD(P)-dependent glycerol-3-phosphate dehydrogenase [Clostridiales bacterium]|nr:NAD(P)-dependent glycerol-3-phosphate dehydrogenase [Clostridiales bacterium]
MNISILGAGTWGVALARVLALAGHSVTVWSAVEKEIDTLLATHEHPNLPGVSMPEEIRFTKVLAEACQGTELLLFAVPSVYVRSVAAQVRPLIPDGLVIADVAKGIEPDTLYTMSRIILEELDRDGCHGHVKVVALSGPTHAEEVARDLPTFIVSACEDAQAAKLVQEAFANTCLRAYTNSDVLGVELCGALKNIMALAAGISAGLGYGDNAMAGLITRGIAEMTRLARMMGCQEQTCAGLAGIGDVIVTAGSVHSRNRRAGLLIGQGVPPREAIARVGMVVEGVNALPAAMQLIRRHGVQMPIIESVNAIINEGASPVEVSRALTSRRLQDELNWKAHKD